MTRLRWSVRAGVVGLGMAALAAAPLWGQQGGTDAVTTGARVYADMCGRCHNPRSPLERTDRDWVTIVNHMRVRGNLTGPQARSVVAFLQATNGDVAAAPSGPGAVATTANGESLATGPLSTDAATIAQGENLVQSKACVGCHVIGATGGRIGPTLNGVVTRRGADFVRQKLANPAFSNSTTMMPNFRFTRAEVEAIAAYLNTLRDR